MSKRQSSAPSKHTNVSIVPNTLLIWLDGNIDENNDDFSYAIGKFKRLVEVVKTFTDGDECIKYIHGLKNKKVHMVISGSLGQHFVPLIHDSPQIDSIFIFCGNRPHHEKWAKNWPKIKGIYTDISPICKTLEQSEESTVTRNSMKIINDNDVIVANLDQLDPSFMYAQILKEILLSIPFERKHFQEFIDFCRDKFANNDAELQNIEMFKREYQNKKPISWFDYPCFLSRMINGALRTMDMNILIKAGFFIRDLHCQIEQLHSTQFDEYRSDKILTVYRGQSVSKTNFEQISKTKGGFMFFNNFLTTSRDRQIALEFVHRATTKPDLIDILFVMTIDLSKSTVPFASITDVSNSQEKHEVLFSMPTVFRIGEIKPIDEKQHLFQIDLKLTNNTDDDLSMLTDQLRIEFSQHENGWYQLGLLLFKMDQIKLAEKIYEILSRETSDKSVQEKVFYQLGLINDKQDEYAEAIKYFKSALAISLETRPPNDSYLASSYSNIGSMYEKTGNYAKALEYYQPAFEIYQNTRPPNHPDLVLIYNSIGSMYNALKDYRKALSFYEKALQIQERTLPSNHPDLASSYNNIGMAYQNLNEFSKAVSFLERAVSIVQNSLPPNHPTLKNYKDNLVLAKKKL